ncbi:hypothetical protein J2Z33_003616 [Rubellimicrobium aerolatum]|nr:hypothetical protein [Rubellimicrobium aerolatum]
MERQKVEGGAHIPRRIAAPEFETMATGKIAEEALRRIAAIYAVEAELRGQSPDSRRAGRQERTRPILEELRPWLEAQLARLSAKSRLAEAIRSNLKLWDGLALFLEDGHLEPDANPVERAIRPIALNRRNALFAGSDRGGEHWAILASLVGTCRLNDIHPHAYLTEVLERLVAGHLRKRLV